MSRTIRATLLCLLLFSLSPTRGQGILFQEFYWDTEAPAGQSWWTYVEKQLPELASAGVGSVWVPSPCKGGAGRFDMGYGPYDLYDLGSKDQKGTTATRFGTKDEFLRFVAAAHRLGIKVYADVVLNHAMGADYGEPNPVMAKLGWDDIPDDGKVPPANRRPGETDNLRSWTGFAPKGADGQKGSGRFPRSWRDFHPNETEPDRSPPYHGKDFGEDFAFTPSVRQSFTDWSRWFAAQTGVDGYRLDNVKGVEPDFVAEFARATPDLWMVGEFFDGNAQSVTNYLHQASDAVHLFDFPLYFALRDMTFKPEAFDMRDLLRRRLPNRAHAVMFCGNHDVSRGDPLVYHVPLAYAVMLAMDGTPSVYYSDFWRAGAAQREELTRLMQAHERLAIGEEKVRAADKNGLIIERRGNLLAVFNSGGDGKARTLTVPTSFGPRVKLTDYVGGGRAIQTDATGRATVTIAPYGYAYYAPPGRMKPRTVTPLPTTQTWEFADDLDTGRLTPSGQTVHVTLARGERLTAALTLDGSATGTIDISGPGVAVRGGKQAALVCVRPGVHAIHVRSEKTTGGTLTLRFDPQEKKKP